eukprot:jgi/Botrbrau1/13070/Bobra.0187s0032.1
MHAVKSMAGSEALCLTGHLPTQNRAARTLPCRRSGHRTLRKSVIRRAAEPEGETPPESAPPESAGTSNPARHVVPWIKDNETLQEVLAFSGPAPERINGRIAMWGFAAAAAAELATHKSVLEQLAIAPVGVLFTTLSIALGSLMPKFASGVSLQELQETCSREGLPPALRFFNKTHEIWLGRVAMIGFLGLVGVELVLGRALF